MDAAKKQTFLNVFTDCMAKTNSRCESEPTKSNMLRGNAQNWLIEFIGKYRNLTSFENVNQFIVLYLYKKK